MIRNIAVLALDFGRQESAEMKFDGIIGTNFLRYFSVEIDYKADIAILSNDWNYADKLGLGKGMSFSYSDGLPVIELGLADGNRAEAQVDTGAGSPFLLFPKQDLARYGPLLEGGAIKTRGSMGGGIYGRSVGDYFARIGEIRVGDFRAKDLPLIFDDVRRITICNGFLAHFKVVLDYPHTRIFLIPNGSLPFETNIRSFGYTVQADADGKARICSLVEGSSAQKAGLELGDLVLKLRVESSDRIFIVIAGKNGGREIALKEAPILPE